MGLFQYLKRIFSREASDGSGMVATPRVGGAAMLYPSGSSPLHVATVYRCVDLLANSVANLRLQYMRRKGEIFVEDTNSRLHYLLTVQPDTYLSAFDFWRQVVTYMLLKGNAYIVPVYDTITMEIARLALVDPSCVAHDTVHDTYTITDMSAGISGTFDEGEVIHIKNYTRDGKIGISTLTYAATTLSIASTGNAETLSRFENGGNVRGIVSNDTSVRGFGEYQDDQLEETAKDLDGKFRTGQRIVSVPGQVQFSPLSLSSTDMQFLETRKFTVREICRFFGVHPSFVYDDTSNNYKSAEMANVAFLSNTLNPILRKIENELHRKLVAPTLCCKRRFEFDRRDLYACDLDSRVKYQASTIAAGIYTVNEWRRAENKEPIKGGDLVLVSANLKSIDEVANPTTSNEYSNNSEEDETGNKE
ncbi:phage portal protein [uncultured Prevotella sp.]|uniref:phage portal protein n=1 Tax=uncultured Prevotella sp. TaxID=159272 RepID=UPI002634F4D7|nr:phage portal protein [uncultured Prevotella sp.]